MHFDESEDKIHLEDVQDVEPLINANKKEANLGADAYKMKGELGKHAGMTKSCIYSSYSSSTTCKKRNYVSWWSNTRP